MRELSAPVAPDCGPAGTRHSCPRCRGHKADCTSLPACAALGDIDRRGIRRGLPPPDCKQQSKGAEPVPSYGYPGRRCLARAGNNAVLRAPRRPPGGQSGGRSVKPPFPCAAGGCRHAPGIPAWAGPQAFRRSGPPLPVMSPTAVQVSTSCKNTFSAPRPRSRRPQASARRTAARASAGPPHQWSARRSLRCCRCGRRHRGRSCQRHAAEHGVDGLFPPPRAAYRRHRDGLGGEGTTRRCRCPIRPEKLAFVSVNRRRWRRTRRRQSRACRTSAA